MGSHDAGAIRRRGVAAFFPGASPRVQRGGALVAFRLRVEWFPTSIQAWPCSRAGPPHFKIP